ncbi:MULTISPECIES: transcriptional regulator PpsR [unclassified Novosphingobium]|uniref:transcriptional regulator PpsR n=1 Tax=Novosphingobium TaxID=165696 RepID=UPI001445EFF6|nr:MULTISPECIES: transcriptional regulator PpsR [unclassified Novosphingobium]NKJ44201.1 transcriptional regulator PpsR [Novosphingobium sp. SG720]NMN04975.1 transcriptional regulator PpsR [Novosphingobium sp. SG919]NMN87268.1 transcriptional regulator PpsR [Novosphingobium sp. SG916]
MSNRRNSLEGKSPFATATRHFAGLDGDVAAKLAMVAGDIALILDAAGRIVDVAADPRAFPEAAAWVGREWLDTVTIESRPKIMEMLAGMRKGVTQHWRQVNLVASDGDIAVRFVTVALGAAGGSGTGNGSGNGGGCIAIGRDMRDEAKLQQRLLQAQQSLERDYIRLRQLEARYRLLFEQTAEPVLIIDADTFRIREANLAAHQLFHSRPGTLPGGKLTALFAHAARDQVIAFLGSAMVSHGLQPLDAALAHSVDKVQLSASGFRERGGQFLLVRLASAPGTVRADASVTARVIESMPDAFVLTDEAMIIREANAAFVELVAAASAEQLRGQPLGDHVGRPGIDLDLIDGQLAKHESARNVMTVVGARDGFEGEPVELSAVRIGSEQVFYGFVIRPIGRRLRDLPPTSDSPRSVEQLTELVGRMSLRDIVRESTDLIERLCIEAALEYTSNNRASAAEILGLSRQSLYSKLHRYGLGNMADAED